MLDVPERVIAACKRGEPYAFEELIRLTHREVYSLALRLVGNPDDAAEVSQETYMKLLRTIKQFRGDSKFSTWLYRVTSSVAISRLRKMQRQRLDTALDDEVWASMPGPASADPAVKAEEAWLKGRLDAALRSLPPGYRTVVVMKDVYGFSLAEVGEQLGISEGAAKVRLFRARQRLKDMLHRDGTAAAVDERKGTSDGMP